MDSDNRRDDFMHRLVQKDRASVPLLYRINGGALKITILQPSVVNNGNVDLSRFLFNNPLDLGVTSRKIHRHIRVIFSNSPVRFDKTTEEFTIFRIFSILNATDATRLRRGMSVSERLYGSAAWFIDMTYSNKTGMWETPGDSIIPKTISEIHG